MTYPQDLRNCTTCHQGGSDSDIWEQRQNVQTCFMSCHDTSVLPSGLEFHATLSATTVCSSCHGNPDVGAQVLDIASIHTVFTEAQSANFQFNIVGTPTYNATTGNLTVIYNVTDTTATPPAKMNLDKTTGDFAWTQGGNSRLFIDVAFPPQEITNEGSGQDAGQPISVDAQTGTLDATTGDYTLNIPIPAAVTATAVTVAMEGHPAAQNPATGGIERIPVYCPTVDVNLDGTPITTPLRRDIVQMGAMADKCKACHFQLSLHGNNRTDNVRLCVLCHNANATDIERRGGVSAADAPDGKTQQAIDFKVMIHGIHQASGITVYGFSGTPNVFDDITFPGILSNCETCHLSGTFGVPLKDLVLDTTTDVGTDPVDPTDNLRTTKTMAVCSSCHTGAQPVSHMLNEGGKQGLTEEQIQNLQ